MRAGILLLMMLLGLAVMPVSAEVEKAPVDMMSLTRDARCGQVLVTALINGVPMRMMLDTGATHTVLHEESVAKLGEVKWIDTSWMQMKGNAKQKPKLLVAPLQVGPGEIPDQPMLVLSLAAVRSMMAEKVDGIIGMDVLRYLPFTFDFRHNAFYWGTPGDMKLVQVPCELDMSGRPHLLLSCGGKPLNLLLDTGSTVTRVYSADWAPGVAGEITAHIGDVNEAGRQQMVEGKPGDIEVGPGVVLKGVTPLLCQPGESLTMLGLDALRDAVLVYVPVQNKPVGFFLLAE